MANQDLGKTSLGMEPKLAACLSYVLGIITGLVFFLLEKENKFVRFHALQSTVAFGAIFVVGYILPFIPFIGPLLSMLLTILSLVLWIVLMVKSYQGEKFKLPVVGDIAEKNA